MNTMTCKWVTDDGDDEEYDFPAVKEVCDECEGHGSVLNPSIGEYAYTSEEFDESFPEDEDKRQYFKRGGIYDTTCPRCKGKNVMDVIDPASFDEEDKEMYVSYQKAEEEDYNFRMLQASERRMGA